LHCESCYSEGGGVLVKLADLGISALVGPTGFQRKTTTPTYAAPEVLKYSGKEPLTEKVSYLKDMTDFVNILLTPIFLSLNT